MTDFHCFFYFIFYFPASTPLPYSNSVTVHDCVLYVQTLVPVYILYKMKAAIDLLGWQVFSEHVHINKD